VQAWLSVHIPSQSSPTKMATRPEGRLVGMQALEAWKASTGWTAVRETIERLARQALKEE